MADVLFTQAHKPSAKASKTAFRFKSCDIFSIQQWPVLSPLNAGRLWSCCSWKSRQTPAGIIRQFREGFCSALLFSNRRATGNSLLEDVATRFVIRWYSCYFIATFITFRLPVNLIDKVQNKSNIFQYFEKPRVISQVQGATYSRTHLFHPMRGKINVYVFVVLTQLFEDIKMGEEEPKHSNFTSCSNAFFFNLMYCVHSDLF